MRVFTLIACAIFLLMALIHAFRLYSGFPISIGNHAIGQEVSWVALVVTAVMAIGLFRESQR